MSNGGKKVRDLMIPIQDCATVTRNEPLKAAALKLRAVYCEVEMGKCTEAGHRTALVLDEAGGLAGILDFKGILGVLIPELAGGLGAKFQALTSSVAFAEADAPELDESEAKFRARVVKNSNISVESAMLKVRGAIDADADIMDALKTIYRNKIVVLPVMDNGKLAGLVRDSDLFLAMADILIE
jgi:CBS domain-containing protein